MVSLTAISIPQADTSVIVLRVRAIDLFAGPGGWDVAAAALGWEPLGVEWDAAACETRAAAGLSTLRGDVAALTPVTVMEDQFGPGVSLDGLIASPPCQAFSMAGKGEGRRALAAYRAAIIDMAAGRPVDVEALDAASGDPRGHLVLEPLRWALALRPRWVALEQVPPVLELWEITAAGLRQHGYRTWTGELTAERYGVPQTRRRAILLARLDAPVVEPEATHARYVAPRRRRAQEESLFAAPELERIVRPEDRDLLPWVSMAEALGWGMTDRPALTAAAGTKSGGADVALVGGSGARNTLLGERDAGRWKLRANSRDNASERSVDEPAPTITADHDHGERVWVTGQRRVSGPSEEREPRSVDEPSYTLRASGGGGSDGIGRSGGVEWVSERPATTINGDPRVSEPGHHDSEVSGSQQANAVRVTLSEALVLQSFPADYPADGLAVPEHIPTGYRVPPDDARLDELERDLLERVVHFGVLPLIGEDSEILQTVVVAHTVDVVHDLLALRPGDAAVLRCEAAASEDVSPVDAGGASGFALPICVERITVQPPLLPVARAQTPRNGFAFAVLARALRWPSGDAVLPISDPRVVELAEQRLVAVFDGAGAVHRLSTYRKAGSTKTKQFEQVGNAIPPLLALACLSELVAAH